MVEIERFVREADVKPTCECAGRKCGPHRCWPSVWGWVATGSLLLYAILMHSFQMGERAQLRGAMAAKIEERVVGEARETQQRALEEWQAQIQTLLVSADKEVGLRLQQHRQEFERRLEAIQSITERLKRLNWALATPDLERDIQLKQKLEELQTR